MELLRLYWQHQLRPVLARLESFSGRSVLPVIMYAGAWWLIASVLFWFGQYLAIYGIGQYEPRQAILLFLEVALFGAPFLLIVGSLLFGYQSLLLQENRLYALHTPGDHWYGRITFFSLVLLPTIPLLFLLVPSVVGMTLTGASSTTILTLLLGSALYGLLATLLGFGWFLLLVWIIDHIGFHMAYRARLLRGMIMLSLVILGVSAIAWWKFVFMYEPPFGSVGTTSFGGGRSSLWYSWFASSPLFGYGLLLLTGAVTVLGYVIYGWYRLLYQRRYEWYVSFRESATRARRLLPTWTWLPLSNEPRLVFLQIECLTWLRDGSRVLWFLTLWILWLVLGLLLLMLHQPSLGPQYNHTEVLLLVGLILASSTFLSLLIIRSVLPYLLPETVGARYLRTVPIAQVWSLRIQLLLNTSIIVGASLIWWLLLTFSGLLLPDMRWSLLGLILLLTILSMLSVGIIRLHAGNDGLSQVLAVLRSRRGIFSVLAMIGIGIGALILAMQQWEIGLVVALLLFATLGYLYFRTEKQASS